MQCRHRMLTESCSSHSYDVNIECVRPQWAGILIPADSDMSTLQHVIIRDSGSKLRYSDWTVTTTISLFSHMFHHLFEDIDIISPASTGILVYPDPFQPDVVLNSISIKQCKNQNAFATEFYQPGVELRNLQVANCLGVRYSETRHSRQIGDTIKESMQFQNRVTKCIENITMVPGDILVVSPPTGLSCDVSISTAYPGGRIGVFVVYSYRYIITIEETGREQTIFDDNIFYFDSNNTVISETNSISIISRSAHSSGELYLLIKAVIDPVTTSSYTRQFSLLNCTFTNNANGVEIYPGRRLVQTTRIIVRDSLFSGNTHAIRLSTLYAHHVQIYNNTFNNNTGHAINLQRSHELTRLSISYNEFHSTSRTVLRIPNDIRKCNVTNNIFWNNTGPYVVEFYNTGYTSSANTRNLEHLFRENILLDNQPIDTDNTGLRCTVITNVDRGMYVYNRFENKKFDYELCFGTFLSFSILGSVNATYNIWGANNESGIGRKIFDFDDWNDRPIARFLPYLTDSPDGNEAEGIVSNNGIPEKDTKFTGGRIFQNCTFTADKSPYYIESDITVLENATLTIDAGTNIVFQANVGILVLGCLIAVGNHDDHIVFRSLTQNNNDRSVRLGYAGNRDYSPYRGLLQVLVEGTWTAICRDTQDYNSIRLLGVVACDQLQFGSFITYYNERSISSMAWLENVQCSGNESMVAECPSQGIVTSNCNYFLGLHCGSFSSTKYNGYWGGIRIIRNSEFYLESVLENVEVIKAGYLHDHQIPAVSLRHSSPRLSNVTISMSFHDALSIDTAISGISLKNVTVQESGGTGIVLYKMDNTNLDFRNVTSSDNFEGGMAFRNDTSESVYICQLGYKPICTDTNDEVVEVDTFAVFTLPEYFTFERDNSPKTCSILIRPKRQTILIVSIFRRRYQSYHDSITVIDELTGMVLHSSPARSNDVQYLTVVSRSPGGPVRVTMNYRYRRTEEIYINVMSPRNDSISHTIHALTDSAFDNNKNGGGIKVDNHLSASRNTNVLIERCKVTSNRAQTQEEYAIEVNKAIGGQLIIRNCHVTDNMIGGIFIKLHPSIGVGNPQRSAMNVIVENVIARNSRGGGMIVVNSYPAEDVTEFFQLEGNLIQHNSPLDSQSVVDIDGVYVAMDTNVIYNNTGGRTLKIRQNHMQKVSQECSNNLIYYNIGMEINKRITIENAGQGLQYHENTIHNSANEYEIEAVTGGDTSDDGSDILIATNNWWGPGSPQSRFRDSGSVAGYSEVIFEPYLNRKLQHSRCPIGYSWHGNSLSCYRYNGGVLNLDDAKRTCMVDGASLPATQPNGNKVSPRYKAGIIDAYNRYATFDDSLELLWINTGTTQTSNVIKAFGSGQTTMNMINEGDCKVIDMETLGNALVQSVFDTSCNARYPYICIKKNSGYCQRNCYGNGDCNGRTCICNSGWFGEFCGRYHCRDVNRCSGFGDCVGPNLCRCRGGWQGRACSVSYCSRYDRCKTCAREAGCGWCDSTQQCLPGTTFSPDKERCDNWFYYSCFTTGTCSNAIDKLACNYRQCEERAVDTDNESCQRCLDVHHCFSKRIGECETWDESKCPSGIPAINYENSDRLMKAELYEGVKVLDNKDVIVYKCPVAGNGILEEHELLITSQVLDVMEGDIIASDQAGGIIHRIKTSTNQGRHTLLFGRQVEINEAVKYADFSQTVVDIENVDDSNIRDNTPDQAFMEDLLSGQVQTNGINIQILSDSMPYKCLGQKYVNSEAPGNPLTSSFIMLPRSDTTGNYTVDDILVVVNGSVTIESVDEIVAEIPALFIHTELVQCDRDTVYSEFTNIASRMVTNQDVVDLICPGGLGRSNLLIFNTDITLDNLDFSENDNIGISSTKLVGKIIFKKIFDDYIVLEVINVQTASELLTLPSSEKLVEFSRFRRNSRSSSAATFHFNEQFTENSEYLDCTGEVEFIYTPELTYTLKSSSLFGVESIGIGLHGTKDSSIGLECHLKNGTHSANIGFGQMYLGSFKFYIARLPVVGSFHGVTGLELSSQSKIRADTKYTGNTKCTGNPEMTWRKKTGMSFYNTDPQCQTTAHAEVDVDEEVADPFQKNTESALVNAAYTVSITAVVPALSSSTCSSDLIPSLPSWLKSAIDVNGISICTQTGIQKGVSFTETVTYTTSINGITCATECTDPYTSVLVTGNAGLDGLQLTGIYRTDDLNDAQDYLVPNGFQGIRYKQCMSTSLKCCSCPDDNTSGRVDEDTGECLCGCFCDPDNTTRSVMKNGICQCDLCPDGVTLKIDSKCPCFCEDGTQREMESDGTCQCMCTCIDGSFDVIAANGECPCLCECDDCSISTRGQTGCNCHNTCPPCGPDETQVWENCECTCMSYNDCGIPPTCVLGRKGSKCDELDCFPCHTCSGNGVCTMLGKCTSACRCNRQWSGECCNQRVPRRLWGDPHLETLDGKPFDYYGIGEFIFCQSRANDFGIQTRFFAYKKASLIGAVAVKAVSNIVTITTPGSTRESLPNLRIDGALNVVSNTSKYMLGNSSVNIDIQRPSSNLTSDSELAVAIFSFQFQTDTLLTLEVRYSKVMERQYINMLFVPNKSFLRETEGLCGFMDDDDSNDFRGPDDTLFVKPVDFAESWRVNTSQPNPGYGSWSWKHSNFHKDDVMDISYTDPNFVPVYTTYGIPPAEVEMATSLCTALGIEDSLLQGCIYDIAVTNDTSFGQQESLKLGCPSQCSGKGSCVNNTCECLQGWSGDECSIGDCGECVRGICVAGFCICDVGWEGPSCDIKATCLRVNNCTDVSHGQCAVTDTCLCTPGFTGADCSLVATCHNVSGCSDHGQCIDFDVCQCNYGWNGTRCDSPSCETHGYCSGNGECIAYDKCKCFPGWKTSSCGIPDCEGADNCSGNGNCIARDTCECFGGFVGSNCSQLLNCSHLNDCSGQGLCVLDEASDEIRCRCYIGYAGTNCSDVSCIDHNDCSQQGICIEPNLCLCHIGYNGSDCTMFSCEDLNFCSGQGSCVAFDECLCNNGWSGSNCDTPSCDDVNDCNQQGQCISLNVCECYEGFDGADCQALLPPNAEAPTFPESPFTSTVPENTAAGTDILVVYANDSDTGRNGQLRYNIIDGGDQFVVDSESGIISTRVVFDYEADVTEYQLVIVAEDRGSPVMSSTATVLVTIIDVNDNCPVINDAEIEVDILSDVYPGTVLAKVHADDADEGQYGQVEYNFYQVSDKIRDLFEIHPVNGTISTKKSVSPGRHIVTVLASDLGTPSCSTEIQVLVDIAPVLTTESPITTTAVFSSSSMSQSSDTSTTMEMSPSGDCDDDSKCENAGVCIQRRCICPCQYAGRRCELSARCYECSMIVDSVRGIPVNFTPDLTNPESEEYIQTVNLFLPLIDDILYSTKTAAKEYLSVNIIKFAEGSLVVHYTITLTDDATLTDKQLRAEMENVLINREIIDVKEGSLSVKGVNKLPMDDAKLDVKFLIYIGCGVGMLCIILIFLTYLLNRRNRRSKDECTIVANYLVSLLGLYVVFVAVSVEDSTPNQAELDVSSCSVLAGLIHYFILVIVSLTVIESVGILLAVKMKCLAYDFKTFLIPWGFSAIVVVVTGVASQNIYAQRDVCFLSRIPLITTVIAPVSMTLVFNIGVYIRVLYQLLPMNSDKIKTISDLVFKKRIITRIKNNVIVHLLVCLTWVAGFLSLLPGHAIYAQSLFCVFSVTLAIVMIALFVVQKPDRLAEEPNDKIDDESQPEAECSMTYGFGGHGKDDDVGMEEVVKIDETRSIKRETFDMNAISNTEEEEHGERPTVVECPTNDGFDNNDRSDMDEVTQFDETSNVGNQTLDMNTTSNTEEEHCEHPPAVEYSTSHGFDNNDESDM